MHEKIVIVVTRSFWNCASCKIHSKLSESIDNHLKLKHPDFCGISTGKFNPCVDSFENGSFSDSELDVKSCHSCVRCSHAPLAKHETCNTKSIQDTDQKPTGRLALEDGLFEKNETRKSSRKQAKRAIKRQTETTSHGLKKPKGDDSQPEEADIQKDDEEWSPLKRNHSKSIPRSSEKSSATAKPQRNKKVAQDKSVTRNGKVQPNKPKFVDKEKNVQGESIHTAPEEGLDETVKSSGKDIKTANLPATLRRGRKRTGCSTDKETGDPELFVTFEAQTKQPAKTQKKFATQDKEQATKLQDTGTGHKPAGRVQSSQRQSSNTDVKVKMPVDKSKIATCCAPWLFDTGRKAGDKVNKKPRRVLLPEEKAAVRELYGIPAFIQAGKLLPLHTQSVDGRGYELENQQLTHKSSEYLHSGHMNLMSAAAQSISYRESDAAAPHRNYLAMSTPSAHTLFPNAAHSQQSLYAGYGGACQQETDHQQFTRPPGTEFYTQQPNMLQSRGYLNYQSCSQSGQVSTDFDQQQVNTNYQTRKVGAAGQSLSQSQNLPNQLSVSTASVPSASHNTLSATDAIRAGQPMQHSALLLATNTTEEKITMSKDVHTQDTNKDDGQIHQCKVCLEKFDSQDLMQKHYQNRCVFPTVDCKRCKQNFHGMHQLNLHVFSEHETEKQGFCFICNQDTVGLENLERHVHRHAFKTECPLMDLRFHDCRICKEELQSSYPVVRTHYYQHHIAHVCAECFQSFDDVSSYVEHCRTHEGRRVYCSICGVEFVSVEKLQSHFPCAEDMWAEDGKGAQCSKCELWCPNRAVVEAHRKQHRSQEDVEAYRKGAKQGFPCVSCEKVFKNKHACRRHIKMVHEGVSCYKHYCEFCGKGFLTKGHMRDHIALHHFGIKRYKCDYCDQQFVCGPTLRRHVRKEHTKHKPYECEHCGERFFEKTPLQRHLTTHTGLAPFMCEHCGKGFYTKHSFTNHGTTHSTARDFVCKGCQKGFTRKYNLQAHMKICKLV